MSPPDGETQGGGQRGGPRRWTGKGPRPARHIPWPELFKHHQSVLTGHLKMMDMVRKHCVEGSGNYITAQACVDRAHEMLRMFKKATATFVPPRDNIERVPLGASSASMYPGYSPADHIYGEAASEFGKQMAELKKKGVELPKDPDGPEYDVAVDKRVAQQQIGEIKQERKQEQSAEQSGSQDGKPEPMEGVEETDPAQLFVIDTNPTPVAPFQANVTTSLTKSKNKANDKAKRRNSNDGDVTTEVPVVFPRKKKPKVSADFSESKETASDDFEAEVEAKHKEKEERRKAKKDKKRKRESEPSELVADIAVEESKAEKPKKKSKRDRVVEDDAEAAAVKGDVEKIKKRKKKGSEDVHDVVNGEEKKMKKTTKDKEAA